jgi:hypothetical protein
MKGYVIVPSDWRARPIVAEPLVKRALTATRQQPAKEKKPRAKKMAAR